ncbi:hypothetical protein [Paenibacillus sp. GCM10027626]|uniref:hypothetical protein n=1 Tax=Paenibacillus sp. GCM10027626 TaxID=3273411 RepID=UPI00363945BB
MRHLYNIPKWGGCVIAIMLLIALLGCGEAGTSASNNGIVKYVIESDGTNAKHVYVELKTRNGTESQEETDIALPYELKLEVDHSKPFNFKSAQLSATASESATYITCQIFYDNQKVSESTAKGKQATATCESDQWPGAIQSFRD